MEGHYEEANLDWSCKGTKWKKQGEGEGEREGHFFPLNGLF